MSIDIYTSISQLASGWLVLFFCFIAERYVVG